MTKSATGAVLAQIPVFINDEVKFDRQEFMAALRGMAIAPVATKCLRLKSGFGILK